MTPVEELDLLLELIRKYHLPLSPILEYAVKEKKEEFQTSELTEDSSNNSVIEPLVPKTAPSNRVLYTPKVQQENLTNNGLPWTEAQKEYAIRHFKAGESIRSISLELKRSEAAVNGMLSRLGLLRNRDLDIEESYEYSPETVSYNDESLEHQVAGIWDAYKSYELQNLFVDQLIDAGQRATLVSSQINHFRYKIKTADEHSYFGQRLRGCKTFGQFRRIIEELLGTWKQEERYSWRPQFFMDYLNFVKNYYEKFGNFYVVQDTQRNKGEDEEPTIKLTREIIEAARTPNGGFTKSQLAAIGVDWPPLQGWIEEKIGMMITESQLERFNHIDYVIKHYKSTAPSKGNNTYASVARDWREKNRMRAILRALLYFEVPATPRDVARAISRSAWGGKAIYTDEVEAILKRLPEVECVQGGRYLLKRINP